MVIDNLEKQGLVEERPAVFDIVLTTAGSRLIKNSTPSINDRSKGS
jgi:DNA-binding MarR family transcriptional regulator